MTVDELLFALSDAFPSFNSRAIAVWGPVFTSTLGKHEGARLAQAHAQVLVAFDPTKRRISHPVISDYLAQLPDFSRDLAKAAAGGKALDRTGHADRRKRLIDDWRVRQGEGVSRGVPQILRQLEIVARSGLPGDIDPKTRVRGAEEIAWETNGGPIILSAKQIRIAIHAAISQERVDRYGPLHRQGAGLWWQQIIDVSHGWGIEADWDDWRTQAREPEPSNESPKSEDDIPL